MSLDVTNVKIIMSKKQTKLKAFVDITFNNMLTCRGWKIIDGSNGLFIAPPSQKSGEQYYDNILFVDANKKGSAGDQMRQHIQSEVLKVYEDLTSSSQAFDQTSNNPGAYDDEVPF